LGLVGEKVILVRTETTPDDIHEYWPPRYSNEQGG
jgi:hypothetical protein